MVFPPLNLLLPHCFTFNDKFRDFPINLISPTPAALLILCFLHHIPNASARKSIILNLNPKETFPQSLLDQEKSTLGKFFAHDASAKGKFLKSASEIDIVHVTTLHELRSILLLLQSRGHVPAEKEEEAEVPDSQESVSDEGEDEFQPILAISGFDQVHQEAGSLSSQSISRTLAGAIEAADAMHYVLVIHDCLSTFTSTADESGPEGSSPLQRDVTDLVQEGMDPVIERKDVDREIHVLDQTTTSGLSPHVLGLKIPLARVYARFMRHVWVPDSSGREEGLWASFAILSPSGIGSDRFRVTWDTTADGLVEHSKFYKV